MIRPLVSWGLLLALGLAGIAGAAASPGKEGKEGKEGREDALTGRFGGRHIALELTAAGGTVEYDCAHGTLDGPVIPGRDGRFTVRGTHTAEHGGPVREGEAPAGRPARYRGAIAGETLTLTVTLEDPEEEIGTFTLTRGAAPRLMKCL